MKPQLVLGRIFGIEIGLHSSWLVLAALVVSSLAGHFSATAPHWGPKLIWTTASLTAVLVFVSLVLHELAHAAVAKSRGLPVSSVTLFALGGVAKIDQEAGDPRTEFWMGLAGPLASAAIGVAAAAGVHLFGPSPAPRPVTELLAWLSAINVALAAFNMIPGFPLDGGRILRAALWRWTGDYLKATRLASRAGQLVACAFLALGGVRVIAGAGLGGLWIALLGWFLLQASTSTFVQAEIRLLLRGVRAKDLITTDAPSVRRDLPLRDFVEESLLRDLRGCWLVVDSGLPRPVPAEGVGPAAEPAEPPALPAGLISAQEVSGVSRAAWANTPVAAVMRAFDSFPRVTADAWASDALELMSKDNLAYVPVFADGRFAGILSRSQLLQALNTRRLL